MRGSTAADGALANALGASLQRHSIQNGGHSYNVVRALPPGGVPVEIWFDAATGLPDRSIVRLNEDTRAIHYADWREAAGTIWPFEREIVYVEDEDVTTLRTSTIAGRYAVGRGVRPAADDPDGYHAARRRFNDRPDADRKPKMLVDVMLNGEGPFPFVFDTGGHFILTSATAKRLKLDVAGRGTKDPENNDGFARVPEVRIGDAVIHNDVAHVIPYSYARLERGSKPPKGRLARIGTAKPLLRRRSIRERNIHINAARVAYAICRRSIPLVLDEDAPLAPCRIDGAQGECMIDTGNASATIVEGHWSHAAGLDARFAHGLDAGDGVRVSRADLDLGGIDLPREIVYAFPQQKAVRNRRPSRPGS